MCLSARLSVCLCLSVCPFIGPSVCPYVYPYGCLSICLSVCVSVCLTGEQQSLDNFISYPKKLQHRLSTKIASDSATDIIMQAQADRDAARLRSLQGRGAGA